MDLCVILRVGLDHFDPGISVNSFPFSKNKRPLDHFDPRRRWRPGMQERKTMAPAAESTSPIRPINWPIMMHAQL
jgi:hypothetical protein